MGQPGNHSTEAYLNRLDQRVADLEAERDFVREVLHTLGSRVELLEKYSRTLDDRTIGSFLTGRSGEGSPGNHGLS